MQKELSQFFQICKKPYLLSRYKNNKVVYAFCKIISDKFITFPKYEIEDLKFHGFPNDEYQEDRWKKFQGLLERILKQNTEEQVMNIRGFLEECHGDDSTRDTQNNVHEPEYLYYHRLFTKSNCIPLKIIYKVYPELDKESAVQEEYNEKGYYIPTGTIIEISNTKGLIKFNDVQDSRISLDFLKFPFKKDFEATIVVSPKWLKSDPNFYRNRNAKWQEMRIDGIKTEDIKIYILKCSRTRTWLKEVFEKGGLKPICLGNVDINSKLSLKDALVNCITKKYRAVLLGKDIYVVKPTTSKNFKLDGEIPKNSYPYDLHNFNIHCSYIPEELVNE